MAIRRIFMALALCALAGCDDGAIGEECDEAGQTDDCEDGLVCTNEGDGAVCRPLCKEHEDCPSSEDCNGVSNTSLKSCQPEK